MEGIAAIMAMDNPAFGKTLNFSDGGVEVVFDT